MVYESGRVKIQAATQADMGPYTVTVEADAPNHMTGRLTSLPVTSTMEADGRKYKYSAELEFKVEVTLHPRPTGRPEELVKIQTQNNNPADKPKESTIDWNKITTMVAWTIIGTSMMILGYRQLPMTSRTTSIIPFRHTIDLNNPRNRRYLNNNA